MALIKDMTEPELCGLLNRVGHQVKNACVDQGVEKPLFVVLLFNDPQITQYVANCVRADVIRAMRECADRLERNEDVRR